MEPGVLTKKPAFSKPVFVTRPNIAGFKEIAPVFKKVFDSQWFTNNGRFVQELEKKIAAFVGTDHCALFCNGTQALELAIAGLGLKGEVITTAFTFPATVHAISRNGCSPVFCDIDKDSYVLDAEKVQQALTSNTSAILAVNVFGNLCNIKKLEEICKENNLKLVFDSAHAFGCSYDRKKIGGFGDAEMFSFHATKLFSTIEGGAITTNNKLLFERLCLLRNFGIVDENTVTGWGTNAKMNELCAAVGLTMLDSIKESVSELKKMSKIYSSRLKKLPGLKFQRINPCAEMSYQYFTVEVVEGEFGLNRNQLYEALKQDNVFARKYFFPPCNKNPIYSGLPSAAGENLSNTELVSNRILCLPIFAKIGKQTVEKICDVIESIYENNLQVKKKL